MQHSAFPKCIHTPNFGLLHQVIFQIHTGLDLFSVEVRGQGHRDQKTVGDTPWAKDVSTYQIRECYDIQDRRYALY